MECNCLLHSKVYYKIHTILIPKVKQIPFCALCILFWDLACLYSRDVMVGELVKLGIKYCNRCCRTTKQSVLCEFSLNVYKYTAPKCKQENKCGEYIRVLYI